MRWGGRRIGLFYYFQQARIQGVPNNLLESGAHKTPIGIHLLDVKGVRTSDFIIELKTAYYTYVLSEVMERKTV